MNVVVVEPGYLPYEKEINGLSEIVDVCSVLSGICYCNSLKRKLKSKNAGEVYEKIVHFIMTVSDINPLADVADTDSLLHISRHQSIPGHYKLVINTSTLSFRNNPRPSPDTPP